MRLSIHDLESATMEVEVTTNEESKGKQVHKFPKRSRFEKEFLGISFLIYEYVLLTWSEAEERHSA